MKNLLLIIIASVLLTSCSKNVIKDVTVNVVENGQYLGQPAFAINAEYTPDNFGENIEDFAVEIVITATPVTNVSSEADWLISMAQPTFTRVIILHNDDFIACKSKMVHGLGYHFDSQENSSGAYNITYTKRML
jgi:hypothetical protein